MSKSQLTYYRSKSKHGVMARGRPRREITIGEIPEQNIFTEEEKEEEIQMPKKEEPQQETEKPVVIEAKKYQCGECKGEFTRQSRFCPNCGVQFAWPTA